MNTKQSAVAVRHLWLARFIAEHPYRAALVAMVLGIIGLSVLHQGVAPGGAPAMSYSATEETVRYVLEHICIALIVAAFVGLGYELAGHAAKMALELEDLQERSQEHLNRFGDLSNEQIEKFTRAAGTQIAELANLVKEEGAFVLPHALKAALADTKKDAKLVDRSNDLLRAVLDIHKRKLWIDDVFLKFVGELLEFAARNAQKLARPGIKDGDIVELTLPLSSVELADKILGDEMSALAEGDSYLVVSDFGSWCTPAEVVFDPYQPKFGLSTFHEATVEAANEHGVTVRRIFARCNTDTAVTEAQAYEVLKRHWEVAECSAKDGDGWPRYQVGIVTGKTFAAIGVEREHRGVFIHGQETLCFSPKRPQLNIMSLQMTSVRQERERFERLWHHAARSCEADGELVVGQTLDEALARLGASWWAD